jgi:hypothetical protein
MENLIVKGSTGIPLADTIVGKSFSTTDYQHLNPLAAV